jgi:thioredoxin-related protein
LLPEVVQWERDYAGTLTLAIISEGSLAENEAKIGTHGIERLLLQEAREVAELYEAHATPAAVLVGSDGTIASYVASGGDAIRSLLHAALARAESPNGAAHIQIGDAAPELALRDLDGGSFTNSDLLGTETLLLFWSPACGYCQQMLPDLRAWELNPPPQAPRLFVISTGSQNENRALMLRSRIAIHDELGSAFGASGTPMAVRLDAEGRVASGVAAGAQAVFALMA